ncbi:AAA family ATPase [Dendronalium sp. ChiSLP03b]|uniref:AAA family ATPase n=1 Tax=Dendronalium sp. ChiSLP03b TaxID=3075381 RepID=UPI002AD2147F|nr:AAA family ATPase [Dendronalium sp. ChiSLP03b]MDZ8209128.1 AAA family ATPase [Dendronalium sp. ChiSLP03b]
MLIGVLNRKGGCGKSTTAVHLAHWLAQRKHNVIVIDSDGQTSSSQWLEKLNLPSLVVNDPDDLFDQITLYSGQYDAVIVDSPAVLGETAKAVLLSVDLALVPVQPSNLDLLATKDIVRLVNQAQKIRKGTPKAVMFLSRASKGTVLLREAQEVLSQTQGLTLLKQVIYQRQVIADAPGQSATVFNMSGDAASIAAKDYEQLFEEALSYGKA